MLSVRAACRSSAQVARASDHHLCAPSARDAFYACLDSQEAGASGGACQQVKEAYAKACLPSWYVARARNRRLLDGKALTAGCPLHSQDRLFRQGESAWAPANGVCAAE